MFSDMNGKTSGTAVVGFIISVVGAICFLLGTIKYTFFASSADFATVLLQSVAVMTLGTGLIAVKKLNPTQDTTNTFLPDQEVKQ
jgi:hypothetical protein